MDGYQEDPHFSKVLQMCKKEVNWRNPFYPQYHYSDDGLLYFEDWHGDNKLCVPESLCVEVMSDTHNTVMESAHAGYHRLYNRLAAMYYWPKMSRDLKWYVLTCDICQKSKLRKHAPIGLLQPIPIPSQPFEVVSMDFIPELPVSNGHDNVLVIVDKLTKYALFIPTTTTVTERETAELFFKHVIKVFGIPSQVIADRDTRWRNDFWKDICELMGMRRSLTIAYHPQADGQTEIMNQTLEISLRAYVGPSRDDWTNHLEGLALAYNTMPHSSTGFAPAYLLRGYVPVTGSMLLTDQPSIPRPVNEADTGTDELTRNDQASDMVAHFEADRSRAKEALLLSQIHQQRAYNNGRMVTEFEEGDQVVLNPHSLSLLNSERGRGNKLLMRYDGPFEILRKISPVTYQLRLPAFYGMHPILNITHLEKYEVSPPEFGNRPRKRLHRTDFETEPEYDVEDIVGKRWR